MLIALIYTSVQFFHFINALNQLSISMNRIDDLLQLSIIKLNIIQTSLKQTSSDIVANIHRLKNIFTLIYPLIHSTSVNAKMNRMDKKMNKILKKLNSVS